MTSDGAGMRVLLTGATGFVGRALVQRLLGEGHTVVAWVRDPRRARHQLGPGVELVAIEPNDEALCAALSSCQAVVNLAGESVIARRWSKARKRALWSSRVELTERLVRAMARAKPAPRVLVSASAVGFYGDRGDEPLDERSGQGSGFLAELCAAWEAAALAAEAHGARVVLLRIGIVLGLDGGALSAMLPAFRAGAGGPLGSGRQVMPWIALNDLLGIVLRGLGDGRMRGAFNATAPTPVDGRAFAQALGAQLDRPARLAVPSLALRAVLGARAKAVLQSQRALPIALEALGHSFEHPRLPSALAAVLAPLGEVSFGRRSGAVVLETETLLEAPLDRAFSFFCRAENLGLITPSFMRFEIVGSPPDPVVEGSVIDYRIRVGPLPLRWRTVIRRWSPPSGFVDEQERGPYALWQHEHILSAEGARTRMVDRVSYAVPFGAVGRVANALFVQSTLRSIFAYRTEAIRRLFG